MDDEPSAHSEHLYRELLRKGIDSKIVDVMRRVPRHRFVPENWESQAYENRPLPIGGEQTISQPYIVGLMTQTLEIRPSDRILEIGTGSGYQTAILAELGREVFTIEILPELLQKAYNTLSGLGYKNVHFRVGDGTLGWEEEAPFDRIIVTAAAPSIPPSLLRQLGIGGRMVIPVGDDGEQQLFLVRRDAGSVEVETVCPVVFVKLIGKEGHRSSEI
jgi:protein-L-isoaspartate(D-aspartate) O-methyltransferase